MVSKKDDLSDMIEIDLSAGRKKGISKKSIEINQRKLEFHSFAKDLALKFSANSPLDYVVKVPSYIVPYLRKYEGSNFEALISLVLESVSFSFYEKIAEDFVISVFNEGVKYFNFPEEMKISNPIQEDTVSFEILESVLDDYKDFLKFFYHDIDDHSNSNRVAILDNSAFALKNLLVEKDKGISELVTFYSDEMSKLKKELSFVQKKYEDLVKFRSEKIERLEMDNLDLRSVVVDLQNQIKNNEDLGYFYFRFPNPIRIVKFKIGQLKVRIRARLHK